VRTEQLALNYSDPEGALYRSFAEVHQRMLVHFQKGNLREECGCTAIGALASLLFRPRFGSWSDAYTPPAVALVMDDKIYIAGAGDSRAVFCYNGQVQRVSLGARL